MAPWLLRVLVFVLVLSLLAGLLPPGKSAAGVTRPNIVVILADDVA